MYKALDLHRYAAKDPYPYKNTHIVPHMQTYIHILKHAHIHSPTILARADLSPYTWTMTTSKSHRSFSSRSPRTSFPPLTPTTQVINTYRCARRLSTWMCSSNIQLLMHWPLSRAVLSLTITISLESCHAQNWIQIILIKFPWAYGAATMNITIEA